MRVGVVSRLFWLQEKPTMFVALLHWVLYTWVVGTAGQEALKQSPDELFVFFVFVFVFVSVFVHCSALYWPSHDKTKYQIDLYCMYSYFVLLSELNKIGLLTQCVCVAFLSQLDNWHTVFVLLVFAHLTIDNWHNVFMLAVFPNLTIDNWKNVFVLPVFATLLCTTSSFRAGQRKSSWGRTLMKLKAKNRFCHNNLFCR